MTSGTSAAQVPVAGDWDGDGDDNAALYTTTGSWSFDTDDQGGTAERTFTFGSSSVSNVPIAGNWNGAGIQNPYRESYVYDGTDILLEFLDPDASGPQPTALRSRLLHGPAVDQLLAEEQFIDFVPGSPPSALSPPRVVWPLFDWLGSTRDLVDSNGTVQKHIDYDSFGNLARVMNGTGQSSSLDSQPSTRFLYTGREFDKETGLQFNRARYFDAAIGRWLSEDPIGFAGGDVNLQRYVGNSPINSRDSSGLADETAWSIWERWRQWVSGKVGTINGGIDSVVGARPSGDAQLAGMAAKGLVGLAAHGVTRGGPGHPAAIDDAAFVSGAASNTGTAGVVDLIAEPETVVEEAIAEIFGVEPPEREAGKKLPSERLREIADRIDPISAAFGEQSGPVIEICAATVGSAAWGIATEGCLQRLQVAILRKRALREQGRIVALMQQTYSGKRLRGFATVVAVIDKDTGQIIVKAKFSPKYKGKKICAEDLGVNAFGGNKPSIEISPAIRPRDDSIIPACKRCQQNYGGQFMPGTPMGK